MDIYSAVNQKSNLYISINIYIIQVLKNKRFNLFPDPFRVQLFYNILHTEYEHFAKALYEDLCLFAGAFLLLLSSLADTQLEKDRVHADKMRYLDLFYIPDPDDVSIRIRSSNNVLLSRFVLQ